MQKGSMRQRRSFRFRMRRQFEWGGGREEAARFSFFRNLGEKNCDKTSVCLMRGRGTGRGGKKKKAMSFTCANMGSAVEMGKLLLYTI